MNFDLIVEKLKKKLSCSPQLNIGLIGGLGSGKTHLVKNLLKKINPLFENQISSPTYNICNIYQFENMIIHHFDLYRIENEDELYDVELWESIERSDVITFIEWVDMFPGVQSKCDLLISISVTESEKRTYHINNNENK